MNTTGGMPAPNKPDKKLGTKQIIVLAVLAAAALGGISTAIAGTDDTTATTQQPTTIQAETITDPTESEDEEPQPIAEPEYADFADVDTYTNEYFILLESTEYDGWEPAIMWNFGVKRCRDLDAGKTIQEFVDEESDLKLVAYAVGGICDHHLPLIDDYLGKNG